MTQDDTPGPYFETVYEAQPGTLANQFLIAMPHLQDPWFNHTVTFLWKHNEEGALVEEWQPDVFVVGLPYNMDDSESELLRRARKFGHRLSGRYDKACYGMDERLSSFEARGLKLRGESTAQLDCLAAQLILETWFQGLAQRLAEKG